MKAIKIYLSPLQDPCSEALLTLAKWKTALGRCRKTKGSQFHVVGPTTEEQRLCVVRYIQSVELL